MLIEVLELPFLEKTLDEAEGRSFEVDVNGTNPLESLSVTVDRLSEPFRFKTPFPKPFPNENPKPEREPLFTGLILWPVGLVSLSTSEENDGRGEKMEFGEKTLLDAESAPSIVALGERVVDGVIPDFDMARLL
jgi:hypothetical protein